MIGIILVAHGGLGAEMRAAVEHILGPQSDTAVIGVAERDSVAAKRVEIIAAIKKVRRDGGVLILTDMVGGTPSNLAAHELRNGEVAVLTGMNLPMLVTVMQERARTPLNALAEAGLEAGRKYMGVALSSPRRDEDPSGPHEDDPHKDQP